MYREARDTPDTGQFVFCSSLASRELRCLRTAQAVTLWAGYPSSYGTDISMKSRKNLDDGKKSNSKKLKKKASEVLKGLERAGSCPLFSATSAAPSRQFTWPNRSWCARPSRGLRAGYILGPPQQQRRGLTGDWKTRPTKCEQYL